MSGTTAQHILLVEDNPADAYLIKLALEEYGSDIRWWTVMDGPEAVRFLRKEPPFGHAPTPALIILDLNLPHVSGQELLPIIRQLSPYQEIPVVVLSSAPKEREETRCLTLGATAYVQKAVNYDAYFAAVEGIARKWLK
jgi:chemotaxis family two-component system response regulator Rcp1